MSTAGLIGPQPCLSVRVVPSPSCWKRYSFRPSRDQDLHQANKGCGDVRLLNRKLELARTLMPWSIIASAVRCERAAKLWGTSCRSALTSAAVAAVQQSTAAAMCTTMQAEHTTRKADVGRCTTSMLRFPADL